MLGLLERRFRQLRYLLQLIFTSQHVDELVAMLPTILTQVEQGIYNGRY